MPCANGWGMDILDAVILGIVEGITEFLPVSSTGHLLVTERALGIGATPAANAYAIVIQIGAILAVLRLYGSRMTQVIEGLKGRDPAGKNLLKNLIVAFIPAAIAGLTLDDKIEELLFGPMPIVFAWIVGGVYIIWWSRRPRQEEAGKPMESLHWRAALGIGLCQCLALWPGTSRSLVTILGGVAVGLTLAAAVEFSFLLGVVTLGAATCYSGLKNWSVIMSEFGPILLLVGIAVSFVSAYVAVKWMVDWINKRGLMVFGFWRIFAGLLVWYLVHTKWM